VGLLSFLSQWWNVPYLVLLGLVGVFFVLQLIGLVAHGDADADAEHDVDADAHGGDHDGDGGEHDADGEAGLWQGVASFFGFGRVPFMVVWVTFFIFAGFAGLTWNRLWSAERAYPTWAFFVSLLVALVVGAIGARLFSRLAGRFVDVGGRGAARKHELQGKLGVVASAVVDGKFGEIRVHDAQGNELLVHARIAAGDAPLKRGDKLVVIDYDAETELFTVAAAPDLDK
jgi:hypothetical protein